VRSGACSVRVGNKRREFNFGLLSPAKTRELKTRSAAQGVDLEKKFRLPLRSDDSLSLSVLPAGN